MLVLARVKDGYPDDVDAAVQYRLPTGLAPLPGPDGTPQAVVIRGPDAGLLRLSLALTWPPLDPGQRRVSFAEGRFRLLLRTPTATDAGQWRATPITGDAVVDRSLSLDPIEAAIARRLGERSGEVVDVEVELDVRGLAPAFPWLARGDVETLRARIAALLGSTPATWDAVQEAFSGLTTDTFTWYPLEPGALPPPADEALLSIAQHAAPILLDLTDGGWVVADGGPPHIDVSLAVPRIQTRSFGLRWSFSEFLNSQADPSQHLIDLAVPAPFEAADLHLVNDVPLAPEGIRSVIVEARTGGPSGMVRHEFLPGEPGAARLRFVRETFEELDPSWRARATVVTARGPAIHETAPRSSGLMIEVNAETLGLTPVRLAAEPDVFEHVAAIEATVGTRTLELTRERPEAWAVGRRLPPTVELSAVLNSGERKSLGSKRIGPQGLMLTPADLGVGEIASVVLRPPDDFEQRAAYLAVQIEGGPWRTVDPGAELTWPVRRESRLQPPHIRYRTRHVARGTDGVTQTMAESSWLDAVGEVVVVDI